MEHLVDFLFEHPFIIFIVPLAFTVFFVNFPSGLVLYWLVNNVLSVGQQYYINKKAD